MPTVLRIDGQSVECHRLIDLLLRLLVTRPIRFRRIPGIGKGDTLPTDADNTATAGKIAWGTLETCCAAMAQLDLAGITGANAIDSSDEICAVYEPCIFDCCI
jgi:hypothetical protein